MSEHQDSYSSLEWGNSPGFRLTPPNPDWAGKSPPVPPVFFSGIVRFSCLAAARGAQDSRGMQPGPESLHPGPVPCSASRISAPCFFPAWHQSLQCHPLAGPRRGDRSCQLQKSCRKSPNPPKIPPGQGAQSHILHRGTGTATQEPQNSSLCPPLPCLAGNTLPGNEF